MPHERFPITWNHVIEKESLKLNTYRLTPVGSCS